MIMRNTMKFMRSNSRASNGAEKARMMSGTTVIRVATNNADPSMP